MTGTPKTHPLLFYGSILAVTALLTATFVPQVQAVTAIKAQELVELANRERIKERQLPLKINPLLERSARAKALDILARDYFAHNTPDGQTPWVFFDEQGYEYVWAGENLAIDFSSSPALHNAWMASPTHAANILNPHYEEVGIAVMEGTFGNAQTTVVVEHFGATKDVPAQVKGLTVAPSPSRFSLMLEKIRLFFTALRLTGLPQ